MGNNKLTGGVDGVGGEVERKVMEAVPGRQRGVGCEGADVVKGEFDVGKEVRPAVGRKRDVDSRHNRDDVIFGGTNRSFHRERAMVLGRDW